MPEIEALLEVETPSGNQPLLGSDLRELRVTDRGITDYEIRLDYDLRVDDNPVYVGRAPQASDESADVWVVQRIEYDVTDRIVRIQVLSGVAWDERTTLGW